MLHRASALRVSLLAALVALPVVVLACGDDDAASPQATSAPDAATALPDAATGPTTISVRMPGETSPDGGSSGLLDASYVVFYPKDRPDEPVFEPIVPGQTVSKSMPAGAHVVVAFHLGGADGQGFIYQYDDVGPGETITFGLSGSSTSPDQRPIRTVVPAFAGGGNSVGYALSSCQKTDPQDVPAVPTDTTIDPSCIGADGNARFVATTTSAPLAISTLVTSIANDGSDAGPLVTMPAWTTPAPVTWSFTGTPPAGAVVSANVFATSTGQHGGLELGRLAVVGQQPFSFVRPPAGFADGELHMVTALLPQLGPYMASVTAVERTAPDAPVTTDLGTLQTHLTGMTASATPTGPFGVDFTSSAPLPSGASTVVTVLGASMDVNLPDNKAAWAIISTASSAAHVDALVLPDAVRAAILGGAMSWYPAQIYGLSGIDAQLLRASFYSVFAGIGARGDGLPSGAFSMIVSSLTRSSQ